MRVLGIETSCDETGVAIYDADQGLLAHTLYSQADLHERYGGVVPELASRDHVRKLMPLVKEALAKAGTEPEEMTGVAYTMGPGLAGALLVGACLGRSLAYAWDVPAVGVHHMEAHLLAVMLEEKKPQFPFLALLVSGGHTLLIHAKTWGDYRVLGDTFDDAVGEAFDKVAKLLGLPYPGGAALAKLAEKGDAKRFEFPRPMTNRPGLDFSFSGLKTFTQNALREVGHDAQTKADIAACFQAAVVDTLVIKCERALEETMLTNLVTAGGVGANQLLRRELDKLASKLGVELFYPRIEFCTDNGAMVAYLGYQRLLQGNGNDLSVSIRPRWSLEDIAENNRHLERNEGSLY